MKLLMLDVETAPNLAFVWGLYDQTVGINQIEQAGYILSWAAKWHGKRELMYNSIHQSSPVEMLAEVHALLDEADAIIHFNGAKFDIPTLNREFVMHGLTPPSPAHQIDLYRVVKKAFKFPSNKLDYVAGELGLGHKTRHKGMELWKGCMAGDEASWKTMETYNKQDVRLLDRLYERLLPWISNHPNEALYLNSETGPVRPTCPNCGSSKVQSRGMATTRTGTYKRFQCQCGKWLRGRMTQVTKEARDNVLVSI